VDEGSRGSIVRCSKRPLTWMETEICCIADSFSNTKLQEEVGSYTKCGGTRTRIRRRGRLREPAKARAGTFARQSLSSDFWMPTANRAPPPLRIEPGLAHRPAAPDRHVIDAKSPPFASSGTGAVFEA
jgi:hypothetical protein